MIPAMTDAWQRRIDRATGLSHADGGARSLLLSYQRMLEWQRDGFDTLLAHGDRLTGSIERDLEHVVPVTAAIVRATVPISPPAVAEQGRELVEADGNVESMLLAGWRTRSDHSFFQKLALQPYAECLAVLRKRPTGRDLEPRPRTCPFCGGLPQLAILQGVSGDDAASRQLLCATCATTWPIGRVCCAQCGEGDEKQLAYFHAAEFDHLRVDTCDSCGHYLKTVDLTRLGLAEPAVDEIAGAPLDLWATERGYRKIELNLVGL